MTRSTHRPPLIPPASTHPTSTAHAPEAYTELVPWAADRLDDLYSKTTLCLRCDAAVIAQIAVYLAVRHYNLPEPKVEDAAGGGGEKKATTWRELFGLGDDAQTFCKFLFSERESIDLSKRHAYSFIHSPTHPPTHFPIRRSHQARH